MIELSVNDMTCGHCVSTVTKAVKELDAGAKVQVDLATKRVSVDGSVSQDEVIAALGEAGYEATLAKSAAQPAGKQGCCGGCG
jgi:copper chaperone